MHDTLPHFLWTFPFVALLLALAIFPLIPSVSHWWAHNRNKLAVSAVLGAVTCLYYLLRDFGLHGHEPGASTLFSMLNHAVLIDYIPFIVLLFSLFTISGGIHMGGDIPAHPRTNVLLLLVGALLASLIGTTGASMLLIRPLIQINSERKHVVHSVIFFIFLVSNIGGSLLPIGDPPLFLGYLRGVPFLWTLHLAPYWLACIVMLLAVYWIVDTVLYRREPTKAIRIDEAVRVPLRVSGKINFVLLLGVVFVVALLVPNKPLAGTDWVLPNFFLREWVQLGLAAISMWITSKSIRKANDFNFHAINEVAALFIGIFITMQVPIEMLQLKGPELGLHSPMHFFWATGILSSFLDNAPTYVVFFETAGTLPANGGAVIEGLATATGAIPYQLLVAISCGAVFMGANSYIGNGPNFMVKSIAEKSGVKMPSFFGYMLWSTAILIPIFIVISFFL